MRKRRRRFSDEPFETDIGTPEPEGRAVATDPERVTKLYNALPGERVVARIRKRHRGVDLGLAEDILRASPDRVEPRCRHYPTCSGCALQHLDHAAQLRFKQERLLRAIREQAGIDPERVLEPLIGPLWGYRRKARMGVRYVRKMERVLVGFRERSRSWLADLQRCEVLHPSVGDHLLALAEALGDLEAREQIPQIEVAVGDSVAVLVVRHLVPLSDADRERLCRFGSEHGMHIRLQSGGPDSIEPLCPVEQEPLLVTNPEFDVAFEFEPADFVQVNFELNRLMVARALDLLDPGPEDRVLDLFCGLGNFTLPLARRSAAVLGVELDAGLLRRAAANTARNGLDNVTFQAADLSDGLPDEVTARHFDKVLLDPPRSGAAAVLPALGAMGVGRIVYVACSPVSLARDVATLVSEHGYRLRAAGIMDMFPHTAHVESIALLEKGCG
jgi:23S rRNA (uracil1939-C5)-methyltransferase